MTSNTIKRNRSPLGKLIAAPHILWSALFVIAPLVFIIIYAFTSLEDGSFTLDNFKTLFTDATYLQTFLRSLYYAFVATVVCIIIAYPMAFALSRMKPRNQQMLIMLVMLPMWMNFLIRTYSLTQLVETNGIINQFLRLIGIGSIKILGTDGAVVLGMVYNYLPYMVLPIYSVMSKIDKHLIEASSDLGCTPIGTMFRVIMPLSLSGIISGITMVFVPSISTFYISKAMSDSKIELIGDAIEREFTSINLNYNMGSALSFILMLLILISMFVMNRFSDSDEVGMMP